MSPDARERGAQRSHERFEERSAELAHDRRRRMLYVVGALAVLAGLVYLVGFSPALAVREVEVVGVEGADRARVEQDAQVAVGTPVARVDTEAIARSVEARPAVESVKVSRSWPHAITVDVVPRTPALAVQRSQSKVEVYDLEGVLIRTLKSPPKQVPTVAAEPGVTLTSEGVAAARSMLETLPAELRRSVRSVTVDAADQVSFKVGRTTVIWGDASQPQAKVEVAQILLPKKPKVLDVSAPDTPVTR